MRTSTAEAMSDATPDERQTIDAYLKSVAMVYTQNLQAHIEERDTLSDEWRRASTLSDYYLRLSPAKARAVVQQLHALLHEVHESTIDHDGDDGDADAGDFIIQFSAYPLPQQLTVDPS